MLCYAVHMAQFAASEASPSRAGAVLALVLLGHVTAWATDWPQYRGTTGDGISTELIATSWTTNSPGFLVWTNSTLTNGFSTFVVSQGRAFTLFSRNTGGSMKELCGALNADTGAELWATVLDTAPWNLNDTANGGAGAAPYNKGDGPRGTPAVSGARVFALSGQQLHLVCLNATNGAVIWSNNLATAYGASKISWENAASPRLDGDLIFINLNTANDGLTLAAFRLSDGSRAWSTQTENMTHTTPVVATIDGVRQVVFATTTGLTSLNCTDGAFLWKFDYPFSPIGTSMGASPLVYSNIVYCSASYGRGTAAARVTYSGGAWNVTQLYYLTGSNYESIWMSPVCYQGYVYTLCGNNGSFLTPPLNCIELATGNLMWSTNNFGMGGLILVNTNLLVLTEKGQLVLVQPTPSAYRELARYQAFQFSAGAPGKCWNSPSFSNGRVYARSTRGGICLDVSVPARPALKLLAPQFLSSTELQLVVGTADGTPIDSNRLSKIEVRATDSPGISPSLWPKLTNSLVLTTNGMARLTNTVQGSQSGQVFITVEPL
jgi:outer membrane protein assembly factor BamB